MDERRIADEPRRSIDRHVCPLHDLLQTETKEHRKIVCDKIAAKADGKELRGLKSLITILVTITCLVVAGQAVWLLNGINSVKTDALAAVNKTDHAIEQGFSTLHRRVSEQTAAREANDAEQSKQLNAIQSQISVITWRLGQIEDAAKINKPTR